MTDREAAIAWWTAVQEHVCESVEPWELGHVSRLPSQASFYDFNAVRVEVATDATAEDLAAEAERRQAGLGHRKLDVFDAPTGERLRPGLEALGWHGEALVSMIHDGPPPPVPAGAALEDASDEQARPLRMAWVEPPHTPEEVAAFIPVDEAVGQKVGAQNLILRTEDGAAVGYTRYQRLGTLAEIVNVFVLPERRGRGIGGALTAATVTRALDAGAERVFIIADAEGRPQHLYARLGFRPAWTYYEFTKILR